MTWTGRSGGWRLPSAAVIVDEGDLLTTRAGNQGPAGAAPRLALGSPACTTGALVTAARGWCRDPDLLVIVTTPRELALAPDAGGIEPPAATWSRAVDVTMETLTGPPVGPDPALLNVFDRSLLFVWTNRWGPSGDVDVVWAPWRAGFELRAPSDSTSAR